MKTHRRKRFYGALLLCSGGALLVDRCMLKRGVTAPDTALAAHAPVSAAPAGEVLSIPEVPFPHAVSAFRAAQPVRDLFLHPSLRGGGEGTDNPQNGLPGTSRVAPAASAAFAEQRRLDAVLINQGLRIAIVDGQWMRTGQILDGCTLQDIQGNSVLFKCSDGDATLHTTPAWNGPGR